MELQDQPTQPAIISETIIVKPENQNVISKNNNNRNIRFFLPDFIRYYLPSQSNMECSLLMQGRGRPQPSPSAAFHSLFRRIYVMDGTNSQTIEDTDYYNTLASQMYTLQKTDALTNQRLNFEGLQPTNSLDNNIYWSNQDLPVWASKASASELAATTTSICSVIETPKEVQISSTLKTDLLNSEKYVPLNVMQGINIYAETEDYRRSLEFGCGSLGANLENGICPGPNNVLSSAAFNISAAGTGFANNALYELHTGTAAGTVVGWVQVTSVGTGDSVTGIEWYCNSDAGICPPDATGGNTFVIIPASGTNCTLTLKANALPFGALRVGSINTPYFIDLACGTPEDSLGAGTAVNSSAWGDGTQRNPFRVLNPISNTASGLSQSNQAPTNMTPLSVGDQILIGDTAGTATNVLGLVTGFTKSNYTGTATGNGICRVYFQPNSAPVTAAAGAALTNGVAVSTLSSGQAGNGFNNDYPFDAGYSIFFRPSERLNGVATTSFGNITADPTYCPGLRAAATSKVDFKLDNLEYHVKKVDMPKEQDDKDMMMAMGQGFKFDVESVTTSLVNVTNVLGQVSNLISIPNIRRALAVLSVPLDQNNQFLIEGKSLNGNPAGTKAANGTNNEQLGLSNYQYSLGSLGRQPIRQVPTNMASFKNPKIQTQATAELIKACDGFGFQLTNLAGIGLNFSLGRQFSRTGMFMDLMALGDLQLLANYEDVASGDKLFVHFIKHLRSITISKNGIFTEN